MQILVAEADAASRGVLVNLLAGWGYEVVGADSGAEAWEALRRPEAPRLAILGSHLGGMGALEVCRAVRNRPLEPYVYIVLLGAQDGARDLQAGIDAGADDYMAQPFDPHMLQLRLHAGRRVLELQDELIGARDALRTQATHDSLTGLWNRAAVLAILTRELVRARREGGVVAVLMADLDHFKEINDTYGHVAGDAVLEESARRMLAAVRTYDSVGRYGGEEFLFVLPGCDRASAVTAAQRLLASLAGRPIDVLGAKVTVTLSVGAAATDPGARMDLDDLIRAADAALYHAKGSGRNRLETAWMGPEGEPVTGETGPTLLETASTLVDQLGASVDSRDAAAVRDEARAVRRMSASLGAKGMARFAKVLEQAAEAADWDTACAALGQLRHELARVSTEIEGEDGAATAGRGSGQ